MTSFAIVHDIRRKTRHLSYTSNDDTRHLSYTSNDEFPYWSWLRFFSCSPRTSPVQSPYLPCSPRTSPVQSPCHPSRALGQPQLPIVIDCPRVFHDRVNDTKENMHGRSTDSDKYKIGVTQTCATDSRRTKHKSSSDHNFAHIFDPPGLDSDAPTAQNGLKTRWTVKARRSVTKNRTDQYNSFGTNP